MPLVPSESPLRRVPDSVDARTVLYLDGIRYSLECFDLARSRLATELDQISRLPDKSNDLSQLIVGATVDAWTMVDSIHRLRELLGQLPGLKKKELELQLFLRRTRAVEGLRHFFQHFRNEIDSFASRGLPLWGAISWAWSDPESGQIESHSIVPGTFFHGVTAVSCTFDIKHARVVERVLLHAGSERLDLADLGDWVERFTAWYVDWFVRHLPPGHANNSDVRVTTRLTVVRRVPPEAQA